MRYRIAVTQEDIDEGRRADSKSCAFARAMTRTGIGKAAVSYENWSGEIEGVLFDGPVPKSIERWIRAWDNGAKVEPIAFIVDFDDTVLSGEPLELPSGEAVPA